MTTPGTIIEVKVNPRIRPLRIMLSSIFVILVIGVGVVTDSPAMQWAGFFMLFLTLIGYTAAKTNEGKGLSISEAKELLDQLEKNEA